MSKEFDLASEREELERATAIANVRAAADIPKGEPGDCETCGEWSGRLVGGMCAPCRDKYRAP